MPRVASYGAYMVAAALFLAAGMLLLPFGPGGIWTRPLLADGIAAWTSTPDADRTYLALVAFVFALMNVLSAVYLVGGHVVGWNERHRGLAGIAGMAVAAVLGATAVLPALFLGLMTTGAGDALPGIAERSAFALQLFVVLAPVANLSLWLGLTLLADAARRESPLSRPVGGVGGTLSGMAAIVPLIAFSTPGSGPFGSSGIPLLLMLAALGWMVLFGAILARRELRAAAAPGAPVAERDPVRA